MADRTYAQLLEEAQELGRQDGAFAATLDLPETGAPTGERCLGRTPAEFARLLWEDRPGTPPSGLEVNAPLWYATGFAEGLAVGAVAPAIDRQDRAGPTHHSQGRSPEGGSGRMPSLSLRRVFT
ncbi:MAG TPA: hypothetical protein VK402_08485 [Blastococcus sp.]|nr:hypothetical protein [Blastococcus sp.]